MKNKKTLRAAVIILCTAVIIEIIGFNYESFFSAFSKSESVSFTASEGCYSEDGKTFVNPAFETYENSNGENNSYQAPYFEINDINKEVKYIFLDMLPIYESEVNEACFDVYIKDEGNSEFYECGTVRLHPSFEKTKYIRLHSYGKIKSIRLVVNKDKYRGMNSRITVNDIVINANVPVFFSVFRFLLIAVFLAVLYMFRPSSEFHRRSAFDTGKKLRLIRLMFMAANIGVIAFLILNNTTFANPSNDTYRQFNLLAEAICRGRVDIEVTHGELMKEVVNPYDLYERCAVLREHGLPTEREPWLDIAYFSNKFYVYFGIVPALIFFLPVYAITKTHMIMSGAVFIVCCLIVLGAYSLMGTLIKNFFPKTSFAVSLFVSVMLANCTGVLLFIMTPTIYYIVILISVMFVFFGLNLWLKAKETLDASGKTKKACARIFAGSLCMALVAGCRPQFLLASFLIIPIFFDTAVKNKRLVIKGNVSKYLCVVIPYAAVASGLMYYNYIRFGSPFDFGANYNLTTNDMPLRGFNLARLVDGIFMYFLQLPILSVKFPFVLETKFHTNYVGLTIIEPMYGGMLFTSCFTAFILFAGKVKHELKEKRLYSAVIMLLLMSVIVACADTEMSALLVRYFGDFLYMLMLGAIIVLLALFEKYKNSKRLVYAMLALGFITVFFHFFMDINRTTFSPGATEGYFNIYSMFI